MNNKQSFYCSHSNSPSLGTNRCNGFVEANLQYKLGELIALGKCSHCKEIKLRFVNK